MLCIPSDQNAGIPSINLPLPIARFCMVPILFVVVTVADLKLLGTSFLLKFAYVATKPVTGSQK
eukprot:6006844-Amphidinium_carterae.1